jgi:Ser/Thr protein kinase RdoA (MazF antagonist)
LRSSNLLWLPAHYNALPAKEREAKLPLRAHPFLSPVMSEVTKFINIKSLKPYREKAVEYFSEELEKLYLYAMQHWEILIDWWYREPLTLIHGDSHLGNFFISGDEMGMLDFQAAQWGKGIRDVQYLLINSVSAETLAQHEKKTCRILSR